MKGLIVISTNNGFDYIEKCINSYDKYGCDGDDILVVDTKSSDESFVTYTKELCNKKGIMWDQTNYAGYDNSAYMHAYENYKYPHYIFQHDSVIIKHRETVSTLKKYIYDEDYDSASFLGFAKDVCPFGNDEIESFCYDKYKSLEYRYGVFGPNFIIKKETLDFLYIKYSLGELIIDNKNKAQATERGWGIMFDSEKLKYKCNEIFTNELFYRLTDDEYIYFTKLKHRVRRL